MLKLKSKSAFTLIELLLVLGVIVFSAAALFGIYNQVKKSQLISETSDLVTTILTRVDLAASVQTSYTAFGTDAVSYSITLQGTQSPPAGVLDAKLVPPKYLDTSTNQVISPFGSIMGFHFLDTAAAGKEVFVLSVPTNDAGICVRLGTAIGSDVADSLYLSYSGSGTAFAGGVKPIGGQLDRALLETYCYANTHPVTHLHFVKAKL